MTENAIVPEGLSSETNLRRLQILDGRQAWSRYVEEIRRYTLAMDDLMREMALEKLHEVEFQLRLRGGVVTKIRLAAKTPNARLWEAEDQYEIDRARRRGRLGLLGLQAKATCQYGDYLDTNPRFRYLDVHHIWPETLGGPTEGWNVLPLPKSAHLHRLHPILDELVRQTEPGTRIRLL